MLFFAFSLLAGECQLATKKVTKTTNVVRVSSLFHTAADGGGPFLIKKLLQLKLFSLAKLGRETKMAKIAHQLICIIILLVWASGVCVCVFDNLVKLFYVGCFRPF